jgi:hypothetical protein
VPAANRDAKSKLARFSSEQAKICAAAGGRRTISARASRYISATGVAIPELALARPSGNIADHGTRGSADGSANRRAAHVIPDRAANDSTSRGADSGTLLRRRAAY